MLKIMTIVGTRPELIKMSRVIAEFDKYTNHILVHTGQNFDYELNQVFFDDMEIRKPNYFLEAAEETAAATIGKVIDKADVIMRKTKPDAVLLYGDTNSTLAVISAKRLKIPVFHMEAGNRCFDQRVPEEINRKILDHISDINLVLTEHSRRYLLAEGLPGDRIIKTGSHLQEVLNYFRPKIEKSDILKRLDLKEQEYFLISSHREENVDEPDRLQDLVDSLIAIEQKYNFPIIISTHPRTKLRLEKLNPKIKSNKIRFLKPFGYTDYIKLQMQAFCTLSDSGTITEESSLLNIPAITIRYMHERPEGMDEGVLIMSGLKADRIIDAIEVITKQHKKDPNFRKLVSDYDTDHVSKKVLRIVQSHIDYVNRVVWFKT
ncbi:MAG: UDP-N-acetylglucosamine 2-epimerase (non-hydrolyzing) [Rickettsiaceae bacterium]|nr:UDP-N-acetylglucosamine 2-epimerase (non-hydrolyzing) [Rickettsiaceae bacterium]